MDKLLIAGGVGLIWLAVKGKPGDAVIATGKVVAEPGFVGTMGIMGGLAAMAQYAPKTAGYAASLAALIALGLWNSERK